MRFNKEDHTTVQLAKLFDYASKMSLLHALYNNQKADKDKKDNLLSAIWEVSYKQKGKRRFRKNEIDLILGVNNEKNS